MTPFQFLMTDPAPLRKIAKRLLRNVGTFKFRYGIGALARMNYAYIICEAAKLAVKLGQERISVLEFGVAGGNGLVWMERHAEQIERMLPIKIDIYGFDTGKGLPPPSDYRDLPYHWQSGFFEMDRENLQKKLKRSTLVFGDVSETASSFIDDYHPAPIAAVSHDLDFYSSTASALKLFDIPATHFMPRVYCYFDDTVGGETELYSDFTGERLAIEEFNASHEQRKIAVAHHLRARASEPFHHQIWIYHLFDHPRYNDFISAPGQQLRLSAR